MQNKGGIDCLFAIEKPAGSGSWLPWVRPSGFWPTTTKINTAQTIAIDPNMSAPYNRAGTYVPMIRPIVGNLSTSHSHVAPKGENIITFGQSHPNPFTAEVGTVEFNFTLDQSGITSLVIYDAFGNQICSLVNKKFEEGPHIVRWDGKDAKGTPVATGTYICRLTSGDHTASIRMLILR